MQRPRTISAFDQQEKERVHRLLAMRIAQMMGRKFEEGDWSYIYCVAKGIPNPGWSNLGIDVIYGNVGIEHKMLRSQAKTLKDECGNRLMHPAATRSIRIPSTDGDPNIAMTDVLSQYASFLRDRKAKIAESNAGAEPELRTGWLLWQTSLREFLYFEEEMIIPDPSDYTAEWKESGGGGSRKPSKNLWVYEKETGYKRYSITTAAGAKIPPYFDVPPPTDPNLYWFKVQGEEFDSGLVRIWLLPSTVRELRRLIGDITPESLTLAIENVMSSSVHTDNTTVAVDEGASPVILTLEVYELLVASFPGVSDEHMVQLLVDGLRGTA
ncbi:MAG: hypothetical protein NTZ05_21820 [Chloroflexi bacterium]|nr:hypothetical protein [Chloroflexota bacterium]